MSVLIIATFVGSLTKNDKNTVRKSLKQIVGFLFWSIIVYLGVAFSIFLLFKGTVGLISGFWMGLTVLISLVILSLSFAIVFGKVIGRRIFGPSEADELYFSLSDVDYANSSQIEKTENSPTGDKVKQ